MKIVNLQLLMKYLFNESLVMFEKEMKLNLQLVWDKIL